MLTNTKCCHVSNILSKKSNEFQLEISFCYSAKLNSCLLFLNSDYQVNQLQKDANIPHTELRVWSALGKQPLYI